jgi:hypothetical protein
VGLMHSKVAEISLSEVRTDVIQLLVRLPAARYTRARMGWSLGSAPNRETSHLATAIKIICLYF